MTAELQATRVDLSGLLEVLGKNLYSTPAVAVRELIQNAHDACIRRRIEAEASFDARIRIKTEPGNKRLIIEDNGAGLTRDEIIEHLATIGSGYTRLLRNRTQTEEMIGYFGLGFLSAYVVGSRVEMWTTSYRQPGESWRFLSNSGERFSVTAAKNRPVGSQVVLELSENFAELSDSRVLRSLLNKYCRLLPIPVYLNEDSKPINGVPAPWRLESDIAPLRMRKLRHDFVASLDEEFQPLCEIPINPTDNLDLAGIIWLHDGSSYSNADNRRATVFVRGMHITGDARDLMPGWAGFASCVIESSHFTPTASREDLQKDSFYHQASEQIHRSLVAGLIDIALKEPETWQRILRRHNEGLLGAAISDEQLFEAARDVLKLPSSEGDYTLPELLLMSGNKLVVTMEEKGNYEEILCRAQKIPVIHGYRYAVLGFVRRYAEVAGLDVNLLGTREGTDALFRPTDIPAHELGQLSAMLARPREKLVPVVFEPDYIPLLLVPDEEALLRNRIESDETRKRISTAALGLAKLYTDQIEGESLAYLYVNMASPLIRHLLEQDEARRLHLANVIRSFMVVVGHNDRLETVNSVADELRNYSDSLLALCEG